MQPVLTEYQGKYHDFSLALVSMLRHILKQKANKIGTKILKNMLTFLKSVPELNDIDFAKSGAFFRKDQNPSHSML